MVYDYLTESPSCSLFCCINVKIHVILMPYITANVDTEVGHEVCP